MTSGGDAAFLDGMIDSGGRRSADAMMSAFLDELLLQELEDELGVQLGSDCEDDAIFFDELGL